MIELNLYLWLSAVVAYLTVGFFVWVWTRDEEAWWVMLLWPVVALIFGVWEVVDRMKELYRTFVDEEK